MSALTPDQKMAMEEVPPAYRGVVLRAFSGKSKAAALKAFCLRCVGYARNDVRDCVAVTCPLHAYRPYTKGEEERDE